MMKGASATTTPTKFTGIQVQTSALSGPIALVWGKTRIGPNLIDSEDFVATPAKQGKGGKGLGGAKGAQTYNYSAAVILGLCEGGTGGITGIDKVWADRTTTTLAALDLTLFNGSSVQAPWSYMVSKHADRALSYANTAYVASDSYQLGSSATLPNHNFEVITALSGSMPGTVDINLADALQDMLTNLLYGIGPIALDATTLARWKLYCRAQGLFFSPGLQTAEQCSSIIDRWAQATNTWIFWSGGSLKFVPLGDIAITANGVTFTPDLTPAYDLTPADFVVKSEGDPPISIDRSDPADSPNRVKLQVKDRANNYNAATINWQDQGLVDQYGPIDGNQTQFDEICDLAVGGLVAQFIGQRGAYNRNAYSFTLGEEFSLLESGDLVTLLDPKSGIFTPRLVRITQGDEDENGNWDFQAEQFIQGLGTVYPATPPSGNGNTVDVTVDPGDVNPPAVFEPRSDLTGGMPQVWIAASGGPNWGGCAVLLSFDGSEYNQVGLITAPAWQGPLTATLPNHADPDTVNTISVDLTISDGVMGTAATHADATAKRTLSLLSPAFTTACPNNVEVIAYGAVAQGAGAHVFNITDLRRALYGTAAASHATGSFFSRIDLNSTEGAGNSVLVYDLPAQYVGAALYLKFVSFNRFGAGLQDVSAVTEYTYTPNGAGFGSGANGVPAQPTGFVGAPGPASVTFNWNTPIPTDYVTGFKIYGALGTGVAFGSTALFATTAGLTFPITNLAGSSAYTFYLVAVNAIGDSLPSAALNVTTGGTPGAIVVRAVTAASSPVALTNTDSYVDINNTSGAALVINLPASPATNQVIVITDVGGNAGTFNWDIKMGSTVIDKVVVNNSYSKLRWTGATWVTTG